MDSHIRRTDFIRPSIAYTKKDDTAAFMLAYHNYPYVDDDSWPFIRPMLHSILMSGNGNDLSIDLPVQLGEPSKFQRKVDLSQRRTKGINGFAIFYEEGSFDKSNRNRINQNNFAVYADILE